MTRLGPLRTELVSFIKPADQTKWKNKWTKNGVIHSTFALCLVGARYCVRNYDNEIKGDIVFVLEELIF